MYTAKQLYDTMSPSLLPLACAGLGVLVVLYLKALGKNGNLKGQIKHLEDSLARTGTTASRVSELESQSHALQTRLQNSESQADVLRQQLNDTTKDRDAIIQLHSEEVSLWHTIEFRRGKRTNGKWLPFCPKCGQPISQSPNAHGQAWCSGYCGWISGIQADALQWAMKTLSDAES